MPISNWSVTASDNDDADLASGIDWREGQQAGGVNDSARAMMSEIKKFANTVYPATVFSASGGTETALATTTSYLLSVDFAATGPTLDATVQSAFETPGTAGLYCYLSAEVFNITAGSISFLTTNDSPGMAQGTTAGYTINLGQRIVFNGLIVGNTYRVFIRARVSTTAFGSTFPRAMRIAGVCR